ncbi:hypothetical protein CZ771_07455 [Actinomycetales bacterium JB111]|nr:hypothetical protein CZ771_07455 [Actinomycetales bacterium JB111]
MTTGGTSEVVSHDFTSLLRHDPGNELHTTRRKVVCQCVFRVRDRNVMRTETTRARCRARAAIGPEPWGFPGRWRGSARNGRCGDCRVDHVAAGGRAAGGRGPSTLPGTPPSGGRKGAPPPGGRLVPHTARPTYRSAHERAVSGTFCARKLPLTAPTTNLPPPAGASSTRPAGGRRETGRGDAAASAVGGPLAPPTAQPTKGRLVARSAPENCH